MLRLRRFLITLTAVFVASMGFVPAHAENPEWCQFLHTNPTVSGGVVSAKWTVSCTGPVTTIYIETKWYKDGVGVGGTSGKTCQNIAVCNAARTLGTSPGTHCYKLRGEAWTSIDGDPNYWTQKYTSSICYP